MFITSAMIGYAKKNGLDYGIPMAYKHKGIYNHFKLPKFRGNSKRFHLHDEGQHGFPYHEIPHHPKGIKLRGFFQSEKYFEHCKDDIKRAFPLRIVPTDRISIHVRRGDYVKYVDNFLPTTEEDVQKIVDYFGRSETYLICSDDVSWCKENLCAIDAKFEYNHGNEFDDLSAMASCKHHAVSRSSFSWWAAWLGHNPDKTIVALTPWFGKLNPLDTKDIIPERWIKI
jgi:hypothetical protein